jgi:hypothetical protein
MILDIGIIKIGVGKKDLDTIIKYINILIYEIRT